MRPLRRACLTPDHGGTGSAGPLVCPLGGDATDGAGSYFFMLQVLKPSIA